MMAESSPQPKSTLLDLSAYTIVIASSEQEEQHQLSAYNEWGKGMTYKEFRSIATREQAEGGWAKDHGDITWALVRRDNPLGEVFSSRETQRMQAFVRHHGEVKRTWVYGVTVINTPIRHRRKGMATRLCQLIHYTLCPSLPFPDSFGATPSIPPEMRVHVPPATASILWSDIGKAFYERCQFPPNHGWRFEDQNSRMMTFSLRPDLPENCCQNGPTWTLRDEWRPIFASDIPRIAAILSHSVRQRLLSTDTGGRPGFAIDPQSTGTLTFLSTRSRYGPQPTWRNDEEPLGLILRLPETSDSASLSNTRSDSEEDIDKTTIVLFAIYPQISKRLLITYIHNLKPRHVQSLLEALDEMSFKMGCPKEAVAWGVNFDILNPSPDLVEMGERETVCEDELLQRAWLDAPGRNVRFGVRDEEEGSLLGIAWYPSTLGSQAQWDGGTGGKMIDTQMWNRC